MPHSRGAMKRLRQNAKRRLRNRAVTKSIKTQVKKVLAAAESGSGEQLQTEFKRAAQKLDRAAVKHVIHPNLAARKKSQLARLLLQKTSQSPAT